MKRFHVGDFDKHSFSKAVRKQAPIQFMQIDEDFQAGTSNGIESGSKGDYLLIVNGTFKVMTEADFNANYEVVEKNKKEGEAVIIKEATKAPKAKIAKKSKKK